MGVINNVCLKLLRLEQDHHQEAAAATREASLSLELLLSTSKCLVVLVGACILVRRMSANLLGSADVDPFSEIPLHQLGDDDDDQDADISDVRGRCGVSGLFFLFCSYWATASYLPTDMRVVCAVSVADALLCTLFD